MAYSVVPKTRRDGKITLTDAAANSLVISYEQGDITIDGPTKDDQTIIRDRGTITTVRRGDSAPVATGSFSAHFRQFTDGGEAGSLLNFINKTGFYNTNTSTGTTGSPYVEFYCFSLQYFVEGTDLGDDTDHTCTLGKVVATATFAEGDPGSFTINFTSYGTIIFTGPV